MTVNGTKISEYLEAVPSEQFNVWGYLEHWNGSFAGCALTHGYVAIQETPPTTYEDLTSLPAFDFGDWDDVSFDGVLNSGTMVRAIAEKTGLTTQDLRYMERLAIEAGDNARNQYLWEHVEIELEPYEYDRVLEEANSFGNRDAQAAAVLWFRERGL